MGSIRLLGSVSLLAVSSLRHREMSLGLKMRAAEVGMVLWKKLRSSTFMARLTGGANMSVVASGEDIDIDTGKLRGVAWGCRGRRLILGIPRMTQELACSGTVPVPLM
jgi:hypothetical protein